MPADQKHGQEKDLAGAENKIRSSTTAVQKAPPHTISTPLRCSQAERCAVIHTVTPRRSSSSSSEEAKEEKRRTSYVQEESTDRKLPRYPAIPKLESSADPNLGKCWFHAIRRKSTDGQRWVEVEDISGVEGEEGLGGLLVGGAVGVGGEEERRKARFVREALMKLEGREVGGGDVGGCEMGIGDRRVGEVGEGGEDGEVKVKMSAEKRRRRNESFAPEGEGFIDMEDE